MTFYSAAGLAHPTSYEGGFALMSEMHPWLGTGVVTMRSPEQFEFATSQIGWLAKRWNLPEAQGNFYLLGGVGYGKDERRPLDVTEGTMYRLGAQADFETRRIYTFVRYVEHRFFEDNKYLSDQFAAAVGFTPYVGEFDELNSWVIFKLVASNQFEDFIYLPILRFFYKNFLWEVGQDFDGNSQFNFMVRF